MTIRAHAEAIAQRTAIPLVEVLAFLSIVMPLIVDCLNRRRTPEELEEYFRQDTLATRKVIRKACNRAYRKEHNMDAPKSLVLAVQHQFATMPPGGMRKLLYDGIISA